MAATVHVHIGLPKTATTYLQTVLWSNPESLAAQGVRMAGSERREHLWATRIVREDPQFASANAHRRGAWDRLCASVEAWPGTVLISHEFFAAATAVQAERMVERLAPADVHLVVTAREPLGLFTASWQESVKNRDTRPLAEYSTSEADDTGGVWNWRTLDLRRVLERWSPPFAADHVHVLPLPGADLPRRTIWDRFARLVGIDPDSVDLSHNFPNESMGVVEAETLRRVNAHLSTFNSAIDRGTYIRTFLADERLVPRRGDAFWPSAERVEECRERGRAAVAYVEEQGFEVIGDLSSLLVPEELPARRTPESVTDAEVAGVAVELVARMLADVRDLRQERRELRAELAEALRRAEQPGLRRALVTRFPRVGRVVAPADPE